MRAQIREQLKNNQGAALSMVMVLLVVMSILGTAMYVYTMQSLKVLEFGRRGANMAVCGWTALWP